MSLRRERILTTFFFSETEPTVAFSADNGKIYHGENLAIMNLLKSEYSEQVKCVYLDPPYNNGEKYAHYSDNIDSSEWISNLKLRFEAIRRLLRDDGSMWVSIDDNEMPYLRIAADQVFGRKNFVATIIWNHRKTRENRRAFSFNHEYILVYAKNAKAFKSVRNALPLSKEVMLRYKNPDADPRGPWQSVSANAQAGHATASQFFEIIGPTGKRFSPPPGRCWTYSETNMHQQIQEGRIWFGKDGTSVPRIKKFLSEASAGMTPETIWLADDVGHTDGAKKDFLAMFPGMEVFDTPKPERLLERILAIATDAGDLVLDPYLGTGTTAAVAHRLGRRFIGIERGDHCLSICVERMKRVQQTSEDGHSPTIPTQIALSL